MVAESVANFDGINANKKLGIVVHQIYDGSVFAHTLTLVYSSLKKNAAPLN